jgi:hypothetical protein
MEGHPDQAFTEGMAQLSVDTMSLAIGGKIFREIAIGLMGKKSYDSMTFVEKYIFTTLGIKGNIAKLIPWELRVCLGGYTAQEILVKYEVYRNFYYYLAPATPPSTPPSTAPEEGETFGGLDQTTIMGIP